MTEVRCPQCKRKLAEGLDGTLTIWCRNCKKVKVLVK
jgi:DNA-directed RNA polymerase subunit RPC12/RpoP